MTHVHRHALALAAVGIVGAVAALAQGDALTRAPEPDGRAPRSAAAGRFAAAPVAVRSSIDGAMAGAWSAGAAIPVPIAEIAGAALGSSIYVGGGFTPPGASIGRWFGRYDTTDDAWAELAELPTAVHHPMMAAAAGRIWSAGGYTGGLNRAAATRRLDAFDPATGVWTPMVDMPGRRAAGFMVALGSEGGGASLGGSRVDDGSGASAVGAEPAALYVVGGVGDAEDRMWRYDVATDRWTDLPGPTPREHLGAAASGGRIYVAAGRGFGRGIVGTLEAYDPASGAWVRLPDMPGACGGCSAAATADGRIHVTGGEGGGRTYADHFVYDPATGAWTVDTPMPTARHGIATAAVGDRFYVIGGGLKEGLDYSTLVEWWAPVGGAPTATAAATATSVAAPEARRLALPWLSDG